MMEMGSTSPGEPIDIPVVPSALPMTRPSSGVKKQSSISLMLTDGSKKVPGRKMSIDEIEYEQCRLEPKTENRIVIINDEVLGRLA